MILNYNCIKCATTHRSDDVDNLYAEHYDMQDKRGIQKVIEPSREAFNPVLVPAWMSSRV